jgi:hypothetical protein
MEAPHGVDAATGRRVLLVDLPVRLWDHARQHGAALVREFAFIEAEGRDDTTLARRLLEIAATSDTQYANLNPAAEAEVEAALARGAETITVAVWVPVEFKQHIIDAVPVLIEVDEYCRNGTLLTLATSDTLRAYWSWYLGEFVRQIDGENPTPAPATMRSS